MMVLFARVLIEAASRPLLLRSACVAAVMLLPAAAQAQLDKSSPKIAFLTEIVSLDFSGSGVMPLGPGGEQIPVDVGGTRAQDYNSSRSNNSVNIAPPDDINPDDQDGETLDLTSFIDFEFDLDFSTSDPSGFAPALGSAPRAGTTSNAVLELESGVTFVFDKDAPDFGALKAAGPPRQTHHGHVTVLKIAFGGGGGDLDLDADGVELALLPGTDEFSTLPNGDISHRVDFTLDLTGSYFPAGSLTGLPFSLTGLTGTLVEEGRITNAIIPEPGTMVLACLGALLAVRRRC